MTREQQEMVLEVVQQAIDGLWTKDEMVAKIEKITGQVIETGFDG